MAGRPAPRALVALVAAAALVAACGGDGGGSAAVTASPDALEQAAGSQLSEPVRIRLALAPDPIWEWLKDSGTVMQWEAANNIRIEASSPFDQFAAFAGGHADMVVINALTCPSSWSSPTASRPSSASTPPTAASSPSGAHPKPRTSATS
ncbi:MAG: hypothetical protein F4139_02415 [Gemmatimonadetes bacterium]|nr:hypothetical protein [Gemmatimonadota bacterium]